jgi:NADH:ubiquinone oxidoreductase subunit E
MPISRVSRIIEDNVARPAAAIAILQDLQKELKWLPEPALRVAALRLGIPLSQIYGLATFYKSFSLKPRGRHLVQICLGTACHVRGASIVENAILENLKVDIGEMTADERFSVECVRCVGCCGLAPVVVIDENFHGKLEAKNVPKILKEYT